MQNLNFQKTFYKLFSLNCQALLPNFGGQDDEKEKLKTLALLLKGDNIKFGNPITELKRNLLNGKFTPENAKMEKILKKSQYRMYK